jgi:quercetin dioxygenase-like cupin family protein
MAFFRFEQFKSKLLTPHLSSGSAPVIEGETMYFCLTHKEAGTGSELHYHPNELLIFPIVGKINAVVGRDRRVVGPGTFVHCPAYARHSMKATEDGPLDYLYIKDLTWTVVGVAADEAVPDKAMTIDEVNRKHESGKWPGQKKAPQHSQAIVDGLHTCYYPMIERLDVPQFSGRRVNWVDGERLSFGFFEVPGGYAEQCEASAHEQFIYVIAGKLNARVNRERKLCGPGDIIQVPRGAASSLAVGGKSFARYAMVQSTAWLERTLDHMTPADKARARVERKAN